ncbi:MAG: nitroreductase/quinone reductase family protein [Thermoflexales bacterium]
MFGNGFVAGLLRSPLHGLISSAVMLMSVKGRRSGRILSTPVNYVRVGNSLWTVSRPERQWWRNLRGGAPATLRLAGRDVTMLGIALETPEDVAAGLARIVQRQPALRKKLGLPGVTEGTPDAIAFRAAGSTKIVVRFDPVAGDSI